MVVKVELKIPGTDVGMRIAVGHLNETNNNSGEKEVREKKTSDALSKKSDLQESECECEECSSNGIVNKSKNFNEDDNTSVDMVTKMFTSLMKCTATNIKKKESNSKEYKSGSKTRNLKQIGNSNDSRYMTDSDEDPLARGIFGKGCSSDFSVSQSLYPDDILVSYEPKKKKTTKFNSKPKVINKNVPTQIRDLSNVRIIPINRTTSARILPNRKFKESKYDVSCISVPTFCNQVRLIKSCNNFRSGIVDSCNKGTRLIPRPSNYDKYEDKGMMISVPSAIYPDNILLTLRNPKTKKKKQL